MAEQDFPNVYEVMDKYGESVVTEMEKILVKANKRATGKLISSLDYDVEEKGDGVFDLTVEYIDYGKYVQEGRRPGAKQPPIEVIIRWLRTKKYAAQKGKSIKAKAFIVSKTISRNGIKPLNFNKPLTDLKLSKDFANEISEAFKKDIENQLKN
jgi:hypothetical protein